MHKRPLYSSCLFRHGGRTLPGWAKELGANFIRLAHYPHDETMLRAADRIGLVWCENTGCRALLFDNPKVLTHAEQQPGHEIVACALMLLHPLVNTQ